MAFVPYHAACVAKQLESDEFAAESARLPVLVDDSAEVCQRC